jgi:hypothetical protein
MLEINGKLCTHTLEISGGHGTNTLELRELTYKLAGNSDTNREEIAFELAED